MKKERDKYPYSYGDILDSEGVNKNFIDLFLKPILVLLLSSSILLDARASQNSSFNNTAPQPTKTERVKTKPVPVDKNAGVIVVKKNDNRPPVVQKVAGDTLKNAPLFGIFGLACQQAMTGNPLALLACGAALAYICFYGRSYLGGN